MPRIEIFDYGSVNGLDHTLSEGALSFVRLGTTMIEGSFPDIDYDVEEVSRSIRGSAEDGYRYMADKGDDQGMEMYSTSFKSGSRMGNRQDTIVFSLSGDDSGYLGACQGSLIEVANELGGFTHSPEAIRSIPPQNRKFRNNRQFTTDVEADFDKAPLSSRS